MAYTQLRRDKTGAAGERRRICACFPLICRLAAQSIWTRVAAVLVMTNEWRRYGHWAVEIVSESESFSVLLGRWVG